MKIEGSIALVTGASRGLGRALVSALVEAGAAKVYATARDEGKLSVDGLRVVALALDTAKPEQIAAAARRASDVTLLVNNAGAFTAFNVLTASQADFDQDFRTNVHGTLAVIKAFVPVLERAHGGAAIVNVLSLGALASTPSFGGYSASKAAAYSMTQALRSQLRAKRIEVLAALPGPVDTDMVKALTIPKADPADVAKALLEGVERGDEDIFPDPMSKELGALWKKSPKDLERALAAF
jgi:NAD(P)-dependent dehydrogenase (short-subunit alcohol dehydrogenase family)